MRRALLEVVLLGVAGGALGCWVLLYGLAYPRRVAGARACCPGSCSPRCSACRCCSAARPGSSSPRWRWRSPRRAPRDRSPTRRSRSSSPRCSGWARCSRSRPRRPAGLGRLLFGDVLGARATPTSSLAAALALRRSPSRSRVLHPAPAGRRLRPHARRRARPPAARRVDAVLGCPAGRHAARRRARPGQPARRRAARRAGGGRARADAAAWRRCSPLAWRSPSAGGVAGLEASYHLRTAAGASIAGALVSRLRARAGAGARCAPAG